MKKFMSTCPNGLSQVLKQEIIRIGGEIVDTKDRVVYFKGDESTIYLANLWSRIANKVFLQVEESKVFDFDDIFSVIENIQRNNYITHGQQISVKVDLKSNLITSIPSTQSIVNKAILKKLYDNKNIEFNRDIPSCEIYIFIETNIMKVFFNTSGDPLFKRGYRKTNHEASIKENLAAGLVILGGWKFKEMFLDPFCGSGTFGLEAGMIAKNIAPGLFRNFGFEHMPTFNKELYNKLILEAKDKVFKDRNYNIILSDIDSSMKNLVEESVNTLGLQESIKFQTKDFKERLSESGVVGTMISNPPYGVRLQNFDIISIYENINNFFQKNPGLNGGIITSFDDFSKITDHSRKSKPMRNGDLKSIFYKIEKR